DTRVQPLCQFTLTASGPAPEQTSPRGRLSANINGTMLRELAVQNLALIEDVRVELQPGFCAWSGETGAGKTLLLQALGLLLGERGSADLIRAGADELRITGRFELSRPGLRREPERLFDAALED